MQGTFLNAIINVYVCLDENFTLLGDHGYLSIVDYPLLPFYGVMCGLYVIMGVAWLVVSANHWRDLLRIQVAWKFHFVQSIMIFNKFTVVLDRRSYLSRNVRKGDVF